MKRKKIEIPSDGLDMFAEHGVTSIVRGSKEYVLKPEDVPKTDECMTVKATANEEK